LLFQTFRPLLELLLGLLEIIEHVFRLDGLLELRELSVHVDLEPEVGGDGERDVQQLCDFMLGKQTDLQIKVGSTVCQGLHAILGDQDEGREKDRLHRGEHGEHYEGRVESRERCPAEIDDDPEAESHDMDEHEGHAARKAGDTIGNLVLTTTNQHHQQPTQKQNNKKTNNKTRHGR